ncbi:MULTISPECIES: malonyl-CoA synthase [unclassified Modicisalibacter]|uniref:malonate--CoA ligase n=1 Tax=unclassified Modicisalibacter TaxID=2679913 RepID=UPI001CCF2C2C|nr:MULTISPECIES: malonyl-CoA synthase [unclassified Modicisalibacter]MBZ9559740.1 malonyl-CoA synthase [Modicisalibacter sp. R2A 31.J]MBZ9577192.1 malonyl-CoA synthase [Modicisalibacter sp. MOD 31.J]
MNHNLFATFAERMHERGDAPFVTTRDGHGYSYRQALETTARLAGALHQLGVRPGDRVAVQVDKSPETLLLYLACLRLGGVYLPLNTGYTAAEIRYFLNDAEPALFVCRPDDLDSARRVAEETGCPQVASLGTAVDGSLIEHMQRAAPVEVIEPRDDNDLAAILYTSGTTGRSKGAMLTHRNLASNAASLVEAWRFTEADRLIHALPIFHTHGLFVACNVCLMAGASLLFLPRLDIDAIIDELPRGTTLMGVPTFYTRLLQDERLTRELTADMRLFTSGSAPLTAETHREFAQRTGHAILERYGMTETNMNTSNPYDGERIAGTVGRPLPGVEIRITQREGHAPVPDGEIGILEVRGPNVFAGYWRMPEKTREELLDDGFFITGDLARIDEHGYVQIVGRDKDLVISGGYNVYPKEVEQIIDELDAVVESAVIGVPHPDFGEGVTAVVVRRPGATLEEAQVIESLAGRLAKYKQPKRVFFVDELPRNTMGKVQKNQLRERYEAIYTTS